MSLRASLVLLAAACLTQGCGRGLEEVEEIAQNAGDALASFDEAAQGGAFAQRMFPLQPAHLRPGKLDEAWGWLLPQAHAAGGSCWLETFSACSSGSRVRSFDSCKIGLSTLTGSVTLTFSDTAGCKMEAAQASLTRTADFTLTGPKGAAVQVSAPGGGQTVTRTADGFTYRVGGMRRVGTGTAGATLFDVSTKTLEDITITGTRRANRVLNGGKLEVTHHKRGYTVVLAPESLTWNGTCVCPVSGKLTGTVTAGGSGSVTVQMTGCGTAKVTTPGETREVTLERCSGL